MKKNEVIICGRRERKLREAKRKLQGVHVKRFDVAKENERQKLFHWATSNFTDLNVLVNNAGIQRQFDFTSPRITKPSSSKDDEVAVNLVAAIRLCALFTPKLSKRNSSAIVNITSGLAFVPIAAMPIYCATKAALHSFTISLRHQLRNTTVRVFEAAPPTTDTELDRSFADEGDDAYRGITAEVVAAAILQGIRTNTEQIIIGQARGLYEASLQNPTSIFKQVNS